MRQSEFRNINEKCLGEEFFIKNFALLRNPPGAGHDDESDGEVVCDAITSVVLSLDWREKVDYELISSAAHPS